MKHRGLWLTWIAAFLLSSCGLGFDTTVLKDAAVTLYGPHNETTLRSLGKFDVKYVEDEPFIYYCDLETYGSMMQQTFADNVTCKFTRYSGTTYWQVYRGNEYIFVATISPYDNCIYYGGSLFNAYDEGASISYESSLMYACQTESSMIKEGTSMVTFDYSKMSQTDHTRDNKIYLPLAYWDMTLGQTAERYHMVTSQGLIQYTETIDLYSYSFPNGVKALDSYGTFGAMPDYYKTFERDLFLCFLDNRYGFAKDYNISSMKYFYSKYYPNYYNYLTSADPDERFAGYSACLSAFGDMHSRMLLNAGMWGESGETYVSSEIELNYRNVQKQLKQQREAHFSEHGLDINAIEYSQDGKTALFRFDSFSGCMNPKDEHGNIRDDIYLEDTFYYIVHQLKEIYNHSRNVTNVVMDISLNGGGYVIIMQKILALLGDMTSSTYSYSDRRDYLYESKVTVNPEEVDLNFTPKKYFDFYMLTSPCSFSCGNALPCFARHQGLAKTIGENSGGGECTVETVCTPGGHYFCFSTDNRMVDYDNGQYYHVEQGCGVDYPLGYQSYYDIEAIAALLA